MGIVTFFESSNFQKQIKPVIINFCNIDMTVLLKNTPLVKLRKLHPGPEWRIFHILTSH